MDKPPVRHAMPRMIVIKKFKHSRDGKTLQEYLPSPEPQDVSERVAELAVSQGWGRKPRGRPPKGKMLAGAPENKGV